MSWNNLDLKCAETGREIGQGGGKEKEKTIRQALAILEEQGLYAMFLKLKAENKGHTVMSGLIKLLDESLLEGEGMSGNDPFPDLDKLAQDLDRVIMARDLIRQALIYGLEHARLGSGKTEGRGEGS